MSAKSTTALTLSSGPLSMKPTSRDSGPSEGRRARICSAKFDDNAPRRDQSGARSPNARRTSSATNAMRGTSSSATRYHCSPMRHWIAWRRSAFAPRRPELIAVRRRAASVGPYCARTGSSAGTLHPSTPALESANGNTPAQQIAQAKKKNQRSGGRGRRRDGTALISEPRGKKFRSLHGGTPRRCWLLHKRPDFWPPPSRSGHGWNTGVTCTPRAQRGRERLAGQAKRGDWIEHGLDVYHRGV
jgi:hypothetical protein